ncbi:MAG: response regulator transcription factor [Actinomycetota bacterium]|nr:response regulator transcription factor [Actinomycetota bacterium]
MARMTAASVTRVVLVEDHPVMRAGVRSVLGRTMDIEIVGEATTGERGTTLVRELHPDVVILDMGLPDMDGIEVLKFIAETPDPARVIIYSCQSDGTSVGLAMESGASGYLTKSVGPRELVDAVRRVMQGQVPMSPEASTGLMKAMRSSAQPGTESLTEREREVWRALADGLSNGEIGRALFISEHTVKSHVHNLLRKLGLHSRAEAICAAHRRGMHG